MTEKLEKFTKYGEPTEVVFQETMRVVDGVECDVYIHPETQERDLGIIRIQPGHKTPLQKVVDGDETIEGYISGKGKLTITHKDESVTVYELNGESECFSCLVEKGEMLQYEADESVELVAFEVCYPPYKDGRFENIE